MGQEKKTNRDCGEKESILKKIERHPIITAILCIVVPICFLQLIYWGLTFFHITCFIEPLSESDLLGFFGDILGSLIGGLIALYVLRVTIQNERMSQKEERRLSLMPMLLYGISEQRVVQGRENSEDIFNASFDGTKSIEMNFVIHNIGLGPAISVELGNWRVGNTEYIPYDVPRAVPKDEKINVKLKLELPTYDEYDEEIGQDIDFSRWVTFSNLLGDTFQQEVFFTFHRLKYYEEEEKLETEEIIVQGSSEIKPV